MKHLFIMLIAFVLSWTAPVLAHDIGVSQSELLELKNNNYELSVQTGASVSYIYATPQLPDHCQFSSNPNGNQSSSRKTFEFSCSNGLTASDSLKLPWRRDGIMLSAKWLDGSNAKQLFTNANGFITVSLAELQAGSGSWLDAVQRYTELGIEHILSGFDHLLFVLALLLIVRSSSMLIKTITAFTVAHSITLGFATLGFIHMPSRPVEAAIALSIVFLSLEIMRARKNNFGLTYRYPWIVAFIFGLLHGLGFAGALADIGLPASEIPVALLFFNVGVEIGQLIFVFAVILVVRSLRRFRFHELNWVQLTPVYFIGTLATYWFIERLTIMIPTT